MTKIDYSKRSKKLKKETDNHREKNNVIPKESPMDKLNAGRSGLSGEMSFSNDQSQNNKYQDPFNPNPMTKLKSKSESNKPNSSQPKSGLKTCPFRNAPCINEACEFWAKSRNEKYSGCVIKISLPSTSMDAKRTAWALIELAEQNSNINVPDKFKNKSY